MNNISLRLTVELVPSTCWYTNVRSSVTKEQWDFIRKQVYSAAYDTCEICGGIGDKWPVECHEVWNYDDANHIQKLLRMIALCPKCHAVKHAGRSLMIDGEMDNILLHFNKVNKCKNKWKTFNSHLSKCVQIWHARSAFEWKLDISHLKNYGIDITKLTQENYEENEAS